MHREPVCSRLEKLSLPGTEGLNRAFGHLCLALLSLQAAMGICSRACRTSSCGRLQALLVFAAWWWWCQVDAVPPFEGGLIRSDGLCSKLAQPCGYRCEEFAVETQDGFLLGVQKITNPSYRGPAKRPVFLNHGILIGGEIWVLNPPKESLGFILADAGHDVWIGNVRTSEFSYGHVSHKRTDKEFWDWSVDELSRWDLQAMMELVYAQAGTKVFYVGYSQGTQAAFAAFSEHRLVDMVEKVVMLAPVAYVDHSTSLLTLGAWAYLDLLFESLHIYEFSLKAQNKPVTEYLCQITHDSSCTNNWVTLMAGPNCCINYTRKTYYELYEPQSTSSKNFAHLAQQYRGRNFNKYDYGFWGNLIRYGWFSPPAYAISNIPADIPFLFFNAAKDALSAPENVERLVSELQSKPEVVFLPQYAHLDFVISWNAKDLIYPRILSFFDS